jgi:hypothetical protein
MLALVVVMVEGVGKRARNRGSPSERTRSLEKVAVLELCSTSLLFSTLLASFPATRIQYLAARAPG